MATNQIIADIDLENALAAARIMARQVVAVYVVLVGLWIFIQSGIPFSLFIGIKIEPSGWAQTLVGWFFVASTGWLLYALLDRGLKLIASAEEALRLRNRAIESSDNAILITDCRQRDEPIVYVNPAFERVTGYTRKEAMGRNPRFLHGSEGNQPGLQTVRLAVQERRACRTLIRNYRKDGTMYLNELTVAPMRNGSGEVTHFVGVTTVSVQ